MHKNIVAIILFFWVIIIVLFLNIIYTYSLNVSFFEAFKHFNLDIHYKLASYGLLSSVLFIVLYTIRPLFFFPASVMTVTSVLFFGVYEGFVVSYIGETLSAVLAYFVGKYFGAEFGVTKKILKMPIGHYFQGNPFLSVFVLRIVPLFPFDFVNYSAGVLKINFKEYFFATALGVLPGLAVFIAVGNSLVHREFLPVALASAFALIVIGLWMKEKFEVKV